MPLHVEVVHVSEGPRHHHVRQDLQLRPLYVRLQRQVTSWSVITIRLRDRVAFEVVWLVEKFQEENC